MKLLALWRCTRERIRSENKRRCICKICDRNKQAVPAMHEPARSGARSAPRGGACRAAAIPKLELKNKIANTVILKFYVIFTSAEIGHPN